MFRSALLMLVGLNLCSTPDETLFSYGAAGTDWVLQTIDEEPFPASATISFSEEGRVTGTAPCNRYFAKQTAPYPWFEVTQIGSTKRACADLALERQYLSALAEMTISEVSETTLILSNDAKRTMIFAPQ